ncbi:MAG TPA: DNA repair protein RecO, partial [candidate division Zixibacteria bacterium]|nr:DNA repair protein RecO [candidate division Zixibacteria bacterium]
MEILSLKAFVLRRIRYGESSLITSLFSEERGKLSVIAKGARPAKSKCGMAAVLEPLNLIEAEVYFK